MSGVFRRRPDLWLLKRRAFPGSVAATGAVSIDAPLLASTSAIYNASVSIETSVSPPLLASASVQYNASVQLQVAAPLLNSASALYGPLIALSDTAPLLSSASALYNASVSLQLSVAPALLASSSALYDATVSVSSGTTLNAPLLASASVLYAHTVTLSISVGAPLLASESAIHAPTVYVGSRGAGSYDDGPADRRKKKKRVIPAFEDATPEPVEAKAPAAPKAETPKAKKQQERAEIADALLKRTKPSEAIFTPEQRALAPTIDAREIVRALDAKRNELEEAKAGADQAYRDLVAAETDAQLQAAEALLLQFEDQRIAREADEQRAILAALEVLFDD